jgi:hypothetical protein
MENRLAAPARRPTLRGRAGECALLEEDAILGGALVPLPDSFADVGGGESAVEFALDKAEFREASAADLPAEQTTVVAATQRRVSELAFSEPGGRRAWKDIRSWAVGATAYKAAATDVTRSMAERAGAKTTEVGGHT